MQKISVLFVGVVLSMILVACGGGGDEGSSADSITLAVWGSSPAESRGLEETVASFEEETGISVEVEVIQDNFQDALTARFAANNAPDVFYMEAYVAPKFIESGVLSDLTEDIENQDDFYQPMLDAFKNEEGQLFAAPKDYSTLAMYVNTDMLEEAGYSMDDVPSDWDDLLSFAEELQEELPSNQAAMIFDSTLARNMSGLAVSNLDIVTDEDRADFTSSPEAITFLESFVEGNEAGYLLNPTIDLGIDSAGAAFGTNKAAIMIEGNWVLSALNSDYPDVNYEVVEAPTINDEQQTMTFNVGYGVARDTQNKEAAVEFVNYMTGDGLEQWSDISGTLPTRESVAESMNLTENDKLEPHVESAAYGTVWAGGVNLPVISNAFDNQFQAALNGDKSIEDAMQDAEQEANDEIERQQ
ncbi:sugar ABC transporter substrate-binding protein [Oceanobacillus jeddahense]|uniref:Extracellular solute-binding protein n=1 Tax=Oceanobacillus jeddahense TaxID=1462527 RepID=A0ABY5JNM7_9BACI|nr:extracellular solute-binding protein [Oceanobacillus jeddahense]UUI01429.1 extracellular solute-binding protein [Oceanobacillus jeddahense]